jgi:phosphotransferase system IIB component
MFLIKDTDLALYIILLFSIIPILILSVIVLIKILIKRSHLKPVKVSKTNDLIPIFGGEENILSVKRDLNRVSIEVKDLEVVDMEKLKALNVGTLIVGNTIKCSSEEIAKAFESYIK